LELAQAEPELEQRLEAALKSPGAVPFQAT
jgi:hypothetical protein